MTAARFYWCGRTTSGRLGRAPTLGRIQIGRNMIHGPMGQKFGVAPPLAEKTLHQNDDCGRLRHDMNLRFDVYESRVQDLYRKYCTPESKSIRGRRGRHKLLLFWNPNVTGTNSTPFPSYPLFLSNKTEHMFPLSK
jgi:hypothetical protein